MVIPKTEFAAQYWGRGTDWCTAYGDPKGKWPKRTSTFDEYDKGPLYIWNDNNGEKYQFHFPSRQFMDSGDRPISHEKLQYFRTQHPVLKKVFAMKEKEFAKNPQLAYEYARDVIGRFPEAEEAIAKDPEWAYMYAKNVIKPSKYKYFSDIIKGRLPKFKPKKS